MLIAVKTVEVRLKIPLPTCLICNSFVARLIGRRVAKETGIEAEKFVELVTELKKYRKKHGAWTLAEVETDEAYVNIRI